MVTESSIVSRLPDFVIIGAMKSGTTRAEWAYTFNGRDAIGSATTAC